MQRVAHALPDVGGHVERIEERGQAADHAPASRVIDTDIVQRNVHAEREKVPAETTRIVWGHVDGPVRDHGAVAESSHEFNVPRLIHRGAENVNPA